MKLYEISNNYQNLLELSENEDVPEKMLDKALKECEGDFTEKAENICKVLKTLELESKSIKEEEKRLSKRRKSIENNHNNLKSYLEAHMMGFDKKKIKGNIFTISIQKNPVKVKINSIEQIPKKYKKEVLEIKVDKNKIKEILKTGEEINGVELEQTQSIRIR